jgi:hypothetical protein
VLETLEIIARGLPLVPDETVYYQLLTIDSILGVPGPDLRPQATRLLQDAAERCGEEPRRTRLLEAAGRIAAGGLCASVFAVESPQNLVMTIEEWQEQEALERAAAERTELPALPRFEVRDLFPGLTLRLSGDAIAHVKTVDPLTFDEAVPVPVGETFEPVPDLRTLVSTVRAINAQWTRIKMPRSPHLPRIQSELDACRGWVRSGQDRADPPVCFSGLLVHKLFPDAGETAGLAFRIEFLFNAALHYTRLTSCQENL